MALPVTLLYALGAGSWIVLSDLLLESVAQGPVYAHWQTYKGGLFVLVTGGLLFGLLRWFETRQAALALHLDYLGKYANDILLLMDADGRIQEANDRAVSAYGYPLAQMLGRHISDFRAPTERSCLDADWQQAVRQDGRIYETMHLRQDGSVFAVEVSLRAFHTDGRQFYQAIIRDISERKRAEQALRESEAKFRNIMESSLVSIYVIQDGVFKYVNPTLLEKSGYTQEDLLANRNPLDLIAPEHREMVARNMQERLAGVPGHPYEIRILRKDGSFIDVVAWGAKIDYEGRPANAGTLVDITERKRAEAELRKLSQAIEQAASTVVIADREGNIEYVNPRFTETTGYTRAEALGKNPRLLKSGHTSLEEYQRMWERLTSGQTWRGEFRNRRKDGNYYWESAIISPVRNEQGEITHFVAVKDDITAQKEAAERLERLVHYDTLTGLVNRDSLRDRLLDAIEDARSKSRPMAVLSFDLDRFRDINDSLGHRFGDKLLQLLAERMHHCCRDEDTVARIGGDEFAAVLPDTDAMGAAHVGQKLLQLVQQPFEIDGHQLSLSCSIGIALFPLDGNDADSLLRNADLALHRAESVGGDNYQYFTAEMNAAALQHLTLENELRLGVQRGELELYFQPQVRLADGVIDGVEALVRWRHPERGLVPPAEFIPLAEESGLILDIGRWVLHEACRQARQWQLDGLPAIPVAVNFSAMQFTRGNVLEQVSVALQESGLEPRLLELELTESVILQDMESVRGVMLQLAEMGVAVSIDDFGTGYSSFIYLRRLHVDKLKIDQSFVHGVPDNEEDVAIVRAIIGLARSLGLNVIAEGVETVEQYRFIKQAGCDQVQGYYCARPVDAAQFRILLAQGCQHIQ